jgi:signal peptidase II
VGQQDLSAGRAKPGTIALVIATAALVVDQITKVLAVEGLGSSGSVHLIGDFLQIRVTRNPGAAFSSLQGSGVLIALVAITVAVFVTVLAGAASHRLETVALGLVLGGALGNLTDRIFRGAGVLDGAVVDFIDFSFFPSFNAADSAITIGVGLLVIASFWLRDS